MWVPYYPWCTEVWLLTAAYCYACRSASWSKRRQLKAIWSEWLWSWEGRTPALCLQTVTVSTLLCSLSLLFQIMKCNIKILFDYFSMQCSYNMTYYMVTLCLCSLRQKVSLHHVLLRNTEIRHLSCVIFHLCRSLFCAFGVSKLWGDELTDCNTIKENIL